MWKTAGESGVRSVEEDRSLEDITSTKSDTVCLQTEQTVKDGLTLRYPVTKTSKLFYFRKSCFSNHLPKYTDPCPLAPKHLRCSMYVREQACSGQALGKKLQKRAIVARFLHFPST